MSPMFPILFGPRCSATIPCSSYAHFQRDLPWKNKKCTAAGMRELVFQIRSLYSSRPNAEAQAFRAGGSHDVDKVGISYGSGGHCVLWGLCLRVLAERCLSDRRPARHPTTHSARRFPGVWWLKNEKIQVIVAPMKRTYQPKKRKRSKTHGFLVRSASRTGTAMLRRRRQKGRKVLSA